MPQQCELNNIHLSRSIVTGIVVSIDVAVIVTCGYALFYTYLDGDPDLFPRYTAVIALHTLLTIQAFNTAELYRFNNIVQPPQHARIIPVICATIFLVIIAIGFALKISAEFSRGWSLAWILSSTSLLWFARFAVKTTVRKAALAGKLARNIVIYGAGERGERLIRQIEKTNEPWNRVVGVFDDRFDQTAPNIAGYPFLGNLNDLLKYGRINRSDEVLIALPWSSETRILEIVRILAALPANIRVSSDIMGQNLLRHGVTFKYGIPMLNVLDKPVTGWGALSKQCIDLGVAGVAALFAMPLVAIIALAIRLESKGPILFRQKRYGFNNQVIEVYKFRSMYSDMVDADAEKLTTRNDARVTKVGAFLRRTSLDELPQLLNVLKGEMSVVGPRPHAMKAKAAGKLYEDVVAGYAIRHKVKPGMTGWAQVNGWRGNTKTEQDIIGRLQHDLYYISNWSIALDLYIILRTFKVLISAENAY